MRVEIIYAAMYASMFLTPPTYAADVSPATTVLQAQSFGAVGNGIRDDGPAVLKMLDAAAKKQTPVRLQFAAGKTYFLKSGRHRYALWIQGAKNLTLDGGGSLFLVDSEQRFCKITASQNITVRNFKVDYVPLPFADGTVVAEDRAAGTIDVKIDAGEAMPPLGGATHADGEQAYFGALWHRGIYSDKAPGGEYFVRDNFDVLDVREAGPGSLHERVVRVQSNPKAGVFDAIEIGKWRFTVPVRGVAHCYGPGESFQLSGNRDLTLENIELWSAPWFAFGITDNRGHVVVRRVNVRPKPGTTRNGSSWRDGFHVKNNRAGMLWEECIVQGNSDDAFNIASHTSTVREVVSPTRVKIAQNYPLGVAAMEPGDELVFYSPERGMILGHAHIRHADPPNNKQERAPVFTLDLDAPVEGLEAGHSLVWNEQSSNPNTILRNCRMDTSCRFRSSVTIEDCRFNALAWFTGDETETPLPRDVEVIHSVFRLGQGNPTTVMAMDGPFLNGHGPLEPVISNVLFDHNRMWGDFVLRDATNVVLTENDFVAPERSITLSDIGTAFFRGNTHAGNAIASTADVAGNASGPAAQWTFAEAGDGSLMTPFAHFYSIDSSGFDVRFHALPDASKPAYDAHLNIGGKSGPAFHVPVPALPAGGPTYLEAIADGRFHFLEFATFVPAGPAGDVIVSVESGQAGAGTHGKPLLREKLQQGVWQTHRVALGATGSRSVRIGLSAPVGGKRRNSSLTPTPILLGDAHLVP